MSRRDKLPQLRAFGPQILPSMLLCDFADLQKEVRALERAGIRVLHLDVMDGIFVPNFTYGMTIVQAFRQITDLVLDVHLMISRPEKYIQQFYEAGADVITIHAEAVDDPIPLLQHIRQLGAASGLAVNPDTPMADVSAALPHCDLALVMSIQPGFGGQKFKPQVLSKLAEIRDYAGEQIFLEIDGGVNKSTIGSCIDAGAELLVVGSAIFRQPDYGAAIAELTDSMTLANGKNQST